VVRAGLRLREWFISTIFVRHVDWKSPKRHALLKDTTGWRKVSVATLVFASLHSVSLCLSPALASKTRARVMSNANCPRKLSPAPKQSLQSSPFY
jgi:hypothetical protein